ncbi:MAG: histidine phosphatase family protein [Aeromicrobium sp.]|uniref:histidine phosphatase family protein n=1 Tax=Aeromicrobium sp. TaxID=1871063 RepID=UPI0039E4E0A9
MGHPVYLVRHGQSEWNLLRLTQGQASHPRLTEVGRRQAVAAGELIASDLRGRGTGVSRIITSDLARAVESAEILSARFDAPVAQDPRLREQHLGELEGRSYEETWAVAEQIDWTDPAVPVAGGESLMEVYDRMAEVLGELDGSEVTILVSHGDSIRAAVAHLSGVKPHESDWVDVPNGAVARITETITWLGPTSPLSRNERAAP